MVKKPKVCVLRTDGTNCDRETNYAFNLVGADSEIVHINSLIKKYDPVSDKNVSLDMYHILAIPGGFSYGDYIRAGKRFTLEIMQFLDKELEQFISEGKPVIGICNGFQVLVQSGLLPMLDGKMEQTTSLTYNDSNRFQDRWVHLVSPENNCIWTQGVEDIYVPVAHGEGKFVAQPETIDRLFEEHLVVYQYADSDGKPTMDFPDNPNGSERAIAGICDPTGKIFGLMPHPERYNNPNNHYLASLQDILNRDYIDKSNPIVAKRLKQVGEVPEEGLGLEIFGNGVKYAEKNL